MALPAGDGELLLTLAFLPAICMYEIHVDEGDGSEQAGWESCAPPRNEVNAEAGSKQVGGGVPEEQQVAYL